MTARSRPPPAPTGERTHGQRLLDYRQVRAWYEARKLRSALSADVYLRQVASTLDHLGIDPDELDRLAKNDPARLGEMLTTYAADLQAKGRRTAYIAKTFDGIRSLLARRPTPIPFTGFPALDVVRGETLANERVPSQEELGRVLEHLSLRGRCILLFMAHSGLRPHSLGSYLGDRGLTCADLPDFDTRTLRFREVPFVVKVPAALSKTRKMYTTFGTSQLASLFQIYAKERREAGERLGPGSPVIAAQETKGAAKEKRETFGKGRHFLSTKAIVMEIRKALRATVPEGVTWRPYVARSYCSTRLLIGRLNRDLREAVLGHDTGVSGRYNVGKPWGEELLAEARSEYARASEFLETTTPTKPRAGPVDLKRTLAMMKGATEREAEEKAAMSDSAFMQWFQSPPEASAGPDPTPALPTVLPANGGNGHAIEKPVPRAEAELLLAQGWTFVAKWDDNRVLIRERAA